jgi:hypothetical protein
MLVSYVTLWKNHGLQKNIHSGSSKEVHDSEPMGAGKNQGRIASSHTAAYSLPPAMPQFPLGPLGTFDTSNVSRPPLMHVS